MNSDPNSDCKQCTESKLGWVHSAHTQNPGRATLRAQCPGRGRCCAHNAQVARMSRAQPAQVARIEPRSWVHVATSLEAIPCRDINLVSRHHSRHSRSRPQNGVATPLLCPHHCPRHDLTSMSRHQGNPNHVATSNRCRDTTQDTPGRDVNFMSRHPGD